MCVALTGAFIGMMMLATAARMLLHPFVFPEGNGGGETGSHTHTTESHATQQAISSVFSMGALKSLLGMNEDDDDL